MRTFWTVVRWVAVLPVAVAAVPVATLMAGLCYRYCDGGEWGALSECQDFGGYWFTGPVAVWLAFMAAGMAPVLGGSLIAPAHRNIVSITLACIVTAIAIAWVGLCIWVLCGGSSRLLGENTSVVGWSIRSAISILATLVGAWIAASWFDKDQQWRYGL